jgi:ketosteroid isomerase-like protein
VSQENVEIVRRAAQAAMRRPRPDWETINELFDAGHRLHSLLGELEGGDESGAAGWRGLRQRLELTGEYSFEIEDLREATDGRVVALGRSRMHATLGDVSVDQQRAAVFTLRAGKIYRTDIYPTWAEALESAGLAG